MGIACKPPRITSAMYAALNITTPIKARSSLSISLP
ncbi:Uncharacterised protein [Vibrio cholerae]|nr:Uncharacterised protein [Vibrio cholerae]CSI51246.1 Uncharacterised protein [Vibrio cholerae]